MGGLASAIRVGSEVTHEDWGDEWIELASKWLDNMTPLRELSASGKYDELDAWLEDNETRIIQQIHQRLVEFIGDDAEHGVQPDAFGAG